MISMLLELGCPVCVRPIIGKSTIPSIREHHTPFSPMIDHPGMDPEFPRGHCGAAGQAGGIGRIAGLKPHTLFGNGINVRTGIAAIAVTSEMVRPERIDVNVEDVHSVLSGVLLPEIKFCDGDLTLGHPSLKDLRFHISSFYPHSL